MDHRKVIDAVVANKRRRSWLPSRIVGTRAAVAVILSPGDGGMTEVLFVVRAKRPGDPWSGHVSFPGGVLAGGESVVDAAMREADEEVGLALSREQLRGFLKPVVATTHSRLKPMTIHPVIFEATVDRNTLRPDPREVAHTLVVGLDTLVDPHRRGRRKRRVGPIELKLPSIALPPDDHILWGLTLTMVERLLRVVGSAQIP